ncbi:MAG: aminotransferase class V-fold PLP-dependent enzyme [Armatimonadaceae bacterium]
MSIVSSLSLAEFRALFPSAAKSIHLNHAGTSPIAVPVADAVQAVCAELMSEDSVQAYFSHNRRQEALREALGRMMNVPSQTLAFVRNTSHAISVAAQSIPFRDGENIVVSGTEYPANVYPWMAQETRGVQTRVVPPGENAWVSEDDLIAACDSSTRVLAVSCVQWTTGQRMDLVKLGTFCRERGILLAADIVQGLGALRIDLTSLPVDLASFGCHKWLLSPGGLGGLYVRADIFPTLLPTNIGWNSVEKAIEWERLHYDELREDSRRFEEGTPSLLATAALQKSVELLEAVGFDTVNDRVLSLSETAHRLLTERGMNVLTSPDPARRTGIVAFRHPRRTNADVLEALAAQKIIAVERGGNLRFSPHAYNTEVELETAVKALPE